MTRVLQATVYAGLLGVLAFGQAAPIQPTFEVADVHVGQPTPNAQMRSSFSGARFELHNASMVDLISTAYGVEGESVYGGPSWLESDRFEVIAKAPPKSSEAERTQMLQSLLADRFKLVIHKEEKPLDVFVLTSGKRVLLKASEAGGEPGCQPAQGQGQPNGGPPLIVLNCRNMTTAEFAKQFRRMAGGYVTHQMLDLTGLTGGYDFTLKWTPRGALRGGRGGDGDADPGISFFEAVDKQLGLKLGPEKRPVPVIVVDSVNRTPTENAPGVSKSLPPVETEFEAAVVKANLSGAQNRRIQPKPGGRIEVENVPLRDLIALAWNMEQDQQMIVGAPKWIETDCFDVIAKTANFSMSAPPPFDTVRLMIRALLQERFKLAVHNEEQPVPVWLLQVAKRGPNLKEADPAGRSGCKPSPGESGKGSATVPMINVTCTNTTMAQFAEVAHRFAGGYVDHPAVDMTGLKGAYDFTISWTPRGVINGGGRGERPADSAAASPGASDPSGGITFFDAVEKQLGLHLQGGQKHPLPVLVVDHVEKLAAEN
jgi:uncharacterized protein (TIGR03435 family)